jgi:hypothetical protein
MIFLALLFLIFLFVFYKREKKLGKHFIFAFGFKLIATISVWYIYTYYYSDTSLNDIYKYFNDGKILQRSFLQAPAETIRFIIDGTFTKKTASLSSNLLFWTKPNQYGLLNDNQTIILINFFLCFLTNSNLLIQSLLISSISFYATYKLYETLKNHFSIPSRILFLFMFFNPSYLVWTSGNFKETFIYIGLMFLFSNLIRLIYNRKEIKIHLFIFINLIFILFCKNYFFLFLIPGILAVYTYLFFLKKESTTLISFSYVTFLLLIIFAGLFYHPVNFNNTIKDPIKRKLYIQKINSDSYEKNALGENRNIFEVLRFKQRDQQFEAKAQHAKTVIYAPTLDGNPITILKSIPYALFNAAFRPNVIDLKNFLFIPDFLINLIVILTLILLFIYKKEHLSIEEKLTQKFILYFAIISLIIIGTLVPVLGNLVRYRSPIFPLLTLVILLKIDFKKVPWLNKLLF